MNPEELLIFARYLATAPEPEAYSAETQWRSSINRAYYAAYTVARALLADEGIQFTVADASHRQVRDKFSFANDPIRKQLGHLLQRSFNLRCRADYLDAPIDVTHALSMIEWASEALKKINILHKRMTPR
jgi:uncharacterized protein (UPF0332 family)